MNVVHCSYSQGGFVILDAKAEADINKRIEQRVSI